MCVREWEKGRGRKREKGRDHSLLELEGTLEPSNPVSSYCQSGHKAQRGLASCLISHSKLGDSWVQSAGFFKLLGQGLFFLPTSPPLPPIETVD